MKKLRTRFALALSIVLLAATLLPILLLYSLSESGLIEATYAVVPQDARESADMMAEMRIDAPEDTLKLLKLPRLEGIQADGADRLIPLFDPDRGTWLPGIFYDRETNQLTARIPVDSQRVVFSSTVFKFRVDLPAWIAIGSLPLLGLLVGLLLSIVLSRSITRPVSQLAKAARAIGSRELSYRVEAKGSQELADLAQSFNRMAEQLEQNELTRRNLMADVAHELRTPLSVLDGNLRAILDGVHAMNEEEVALLYEQIQHLNRLVEDLRELSLAEADQLSLNFQKVDLTHLVKETAAHFNITAQEKDIQLVLELDDPLTHLSLDENRMRQVLHNLLSNALRYTPPGGKVTISARQFAEPKVVEIAVADTGAGISAEDLPHIFDRFYRTDETASRDRGGTGLGLTIVKAIVNAMGGAIEAQSGGKDRGSTFIIRFIDPGRTPTQEN